MSYNFHIEILNRFVIIVVCCYNIVYYISITVNNNKLLFFFALCGTVSVTNVFYGQASAGVTKPTDG